MKTTDSAHIDVPIEKSVEKKDDFAQPITDLKDFEGLSHNFKRRKLTKMTGVGDTGSKQLYPEQVATVGYGVFDVVNPPYNLEELASFYDNSGGNHAAINAKTANIVGLGYDFEVIESLKVRLSEMESPEQLKRAQAKIERAKAQLREWLDTLNDEDTFMHVLEKVWIDVESTGNGYIEVGRTVTGEIGYVGHIPSISIRIRRKRDGFIQMIGNKVTYFKNFGRNETNSITSDPRPNELIHIKKYSPRNSYYGVPDTVSAAMAIVGNELSGKFNIDYFENKAVPRYIVLLKGATMSPESEDKLFRFMQSGLRGQNHRTLFIPLPADTPEGKVEFSMEPIENQQIDASFIEYRKQNINDTLLSHGVPFSRVGGGNNQPLAAALAADRVFKESVARPAQDRLEKVITKIIGEKTDALKFTLRGLTLTDELTQSQIDERMVRNQVVVPNEIRGRMGLSPIKGGDEVVQQKPQAAAEARAQTAGTRQRDQQRTANNSDSTTTVAGRNPQGAGRKQP